MPEWFNGYRSNKRNDMASAAQVRSLLLPGFFFYSFSFLPPGFSIYQNERGLNDAGGAAAVAGGGSVGGVGGGYP